MRGWKELGKGWKSWPRELGAGFSLKLGNRRADLEPAKRNTLTEWKGTVWTGDRKENAVEVWAATHWDAAGLVERVLSEGVDMDDPSLDGIVEEQSAPALDPDQDGGSAA